MSIEKQEHEFKVGSPARLVVRNIRGLVELLPGEDEVIRIEVAVHNDDGNADDTRINLNQEKDGTVRAEVKMEEVIFGIGRRRPLRVDFKIHAPAKTDISAKTVSGKVLASGFEGEIELGSVSGAIEVENLTGFLDLDAVSGRITGTGLKGEGKVDAVSGRLDLRDCDFETLKASTVSGKALVQTAFGEGPYKLSSVSGSVTLVAPEESGCQVDASAVSGRFYTDLEVSSSQVSRRHWKVVLGEGGPNVRMSTVSGRMKLLSSFDAKGKVPGAVNGMSREKRRELLDKLSEGEISVDDAMKALAP